MHSHTLGAKHQTVVVTLLLLLLTEAIQTRKLDHGDHEQPKAQTYDLHFNPGRRELQPVHSRALG